MQTVNEKLTQTLISSRLLSCQNGRDECVSLLLQQIVDPNIVNKIGHSPLLVACQDDRNKCISLLLQHQADPNIINNMNGFSALHNMYRCYYSTMQIQILLKY